MKTLNSKISLQKAIDLVGGQSALADEINIQKAAPPQITQQHVWNWLHRQGQAPAKYCLFIEVATKHEITRNHLRPDVFGAPS